MLKNFFDELRHYYHPLFASFVLLFIGTFILTEYKMELVLPQSDKLLHVAGGMIAAWLVYIHYRHIHIHLELPKLRLLIVAGVALIGVIWEFAEYLSANYGALISPLLVRYFHGGDLTDTLGDLGADLLGAFIFVLMVGLYRKRIIPE
jgi:hypothetical protein